MIYLIGGAPRSGKSLLGQRVAASLQSNWISTDLLKSVLRVGGTEVVDVAWNEVDSITAAAEWFFPYLAAFVRGAAYMAEAMSSIIS